MNPFLLLAGGASLAALYAITRAKSTTAPRPGGDPQTDAYLATINTSTPAPRAGPGDLSAQLTDSATRLVSGLGKIGLLGTAIGTIAGGIQTAIGWLGLTAPPLAIVVLVVVAVIIIVAVICWLIGAFNAEQADLAKGRAGAFAELVDMAEKARVAALNVQGLSPEAGALFARVWGFRLAEAYNAKRRAAVEADWNKDRNGDAASREAHFNFWAERGKFVEDFHLYGPKKTIALPPPRPGMPSPGSVTVDTLEAQMFGSGNTVGQAEAALGAAWSPACRKSVAFQGAVSGVLVTALGGGPTPYYRLGGKPVGSYDNAVSFVRAVYFSVRESPGVFFPAGTAVCYDPQGNIALLWEKDSGLVWNFLESYNKHEIVIATAPPVPGLYRVAAFDPWLVHSAGTTGTKWLGNQHGPTVTAPQAQAMWDSARDDSGFAINAQTARPLDPRTNVEFPVVAGKLTINYTPELA